MAFRSPNPRGSNKRPPAVYGKQPQTATAAQEALWQGEVSDLGGLGDAVVRRGGEVVLVAGGAPGDRLLLRSLARRAGVERATLVAVQQPGPARRPAPCPVADRCGGCAWQHIADDVQTATRQRIAARALGLQTEAVAVARVPALGYRRRARLHLRTHNHQLQIGFLAHNSDALVAIDRCLVLDPALTPLLQLAPSVLAPWVDRGELTVLLGAHPEQPDQPALLVHLTARPRRDAVLRGPVAEQLRAVLNVAGLHLQLGSLEQHAGLVEAILPETAKQTPVLASASGFAQASAAGNAAIRRTVRELLTQMAERRQQTGEPLGAAMEWFAGSGNLSSVLATFVPRLVCVEWDPAAIGRLQRGLAPAVAAGLELRTVCEDAAAVPGPPEGDWLAVLDPGRPGALALCTHWAAAAPRQQPRDIVYVSCAADTLQRDVRVLRQAGWQVERAVLIDTYGQTPRVELALWLHKSSPNP